MSLKYQRVKQADLLLPAPLRWLTRAFSSITLAVVLLALVAVYGTLASVPIAFLVKGLVYAGIFLALVAAPVAAALRIGHGRWLGSGGWGRPVRLAVACLVVLSGFVAAVIAWGAAADAMARHPWFLAHRATVLYRLPMFEMTELEFYSWWPLKLVLFLFVLNLIWATVRRIEFKFVNLGVLTVHSGIVTIAVGSIWYGGLKLEGDTVLWRSDLGGEPVSTFYDAKEPAIYFTLGRKNLMVPAPALPRYNDYPDGQLDLRLHDDEMFRQVMGPNLRATIRGFVSYGTLEPAWVEAPPDAAARAHGLNPAVRVQLGDAERPDGSLDRTLVSRVPAQRVIEEEMWALEFLADPAEERIEDLMAEFPGEHGLVVEVPGQGFRGVYPIAAGSEISVGDTGYRIRVEAVGPYEMSFATPGYEGATDTRAMVQIFPPPPAPGSRGMAGEGVERTEDASHGSAPAAQSEDQPPSHADTPTQPPPQRGRGQRESSPPTVTAPPFRRIVMHRYPERSQDFVPAPGDPTAGPMGRRTAPDPAIRLAYIDSSKAQFRLIQQRGSDDLQLLFRLPAERPVFGSLAADKLPLGRLADREIWLHVTQRLNNAMQVLEPRITPREHRQPKDEGTYLHALVPVDLEMDLPESVRPTGASPQGTTSGGVWRQRVWLAHMRYPMMPEGVKRPATVNVPTLGPVQVAFSRQSYPLPFALSLEAFEMRPYPGSDIPLDYVATLRVTDLDDEGMPVGSEPTVATSHLNNPLVYRAGSGPWRLRKVKISQTGWDPGDPRDPNHQQRDAQGRYLNQQRFTILGIGNNAGIQVIFVGACLMAVGIPWAFYVKPLLVQRQKRRLQAAVAEAPQPRKRRVREPEPALNA